LIELCVFDLDGTLVNSLADLADSTNYALKKNGFVTCPADRYRFFVGNGVPMLIKRALGGQASPEAEKAVLCDFNAYYNTHYADHTRPYDGNVELLEALRARGVKCAVLSNKPDNFVKIIVAEILPQFRFSWVQGKAEGFPKKPDPAALNFILHSLGVKKENTLYIGDSNVDIFTGKNAGVMTCGVLWGFRGRDELEEAGACHIVSEPKEILGLL
jgi:phosphoglycolate phosphatase